MKGKYILDSAALFKIGVVDPELAYTTQENVDEVIVEYEKALVLKYIREGRLIIKEPDEEHYKKALMVADPKLSFVDIKTLALAVEINEKDSVPVITDDYSLQNALSRLGIRFMPLKTNGIRKTYRWAYRCEWCGSYFHVDLGECPKCGGPIKRVIVPVKRHN